MVPVEVRDEVRGPVHGAVPVALENVPVNPALQVVLASADGQQWDVHRDLDVDVQLAERLAQLGHRLGELQTLLRRHVHRVAADEVVAELPDRPLDLVDVDRDVAAAQVAQQRAEGGVRVRRVVDGLIAGDEVEEGWWKREPREVGLHEVQVRNVVKPLIGQVDALADVDAEDRGAGVPGIQLGIAPLAGTGVEDEALVLEEALETAQVAVAVALEVPTYVVRLGVLAVVWSALPLLREAGARLALSRHPH